MSLYLYVPRTATVRERGALLRQIFRPGRALVLTPDGIQAMADGRVRSHPGAFLAVFEPATGEPLAALALGADGGLWALQGAGARVRRFTVDAVDARPAFLAAALTGGPLLLEGRQACTTVALPARPHLLATLDGGTLPEHLLAVADDDGIYALRWREDTGAVHRQPLSGERASALLALPGEPPLLAARIRGPGYDRLRLWQGTPGPWFGLGFRPLPELRLHPDLPLALRNDGPVMAAAGLGIWLRLVGGIWQPDASFSEVGLPTLLYQGRGARFLPHPPLRSWHELPTGSVPPRRGS